MHEVQQYVRSIRNIEVWPSCTLYLYDLPCRFLSIDVRELEDTPDVAHRLLSCGRWEGGGAKIEARSSLGSMIFAARLRHEPEPKRAVLLLLPVVTTFD